MSNRTHFGAKQARQVIESIKREFEARHFPDPVRTAPPAEAAQYLAEMNAGASALATLEMNANNAHRFGTAPTKLSREEYEARCRHFARQMEALIPDAEARAHAVQAYRERELLNVAEE
jgi:hypothetical protein